MGDPISFHPSSPKWGPPPLHRLPPGKKRPCDADCYVRLIIMATKHRVLVKHFRDTFFKDNFSIDFSEWKAGGGGGGGGERKT